MCTTESNEIYKTCIYIYKSLKQKNIYILLLILENEIIHITASHFPALLGVYPKGEEQYQITSFSRILIHFYKEYQNL